MEIILLRHGKAEPHGHPQGDAARALVPKGEEQSRRAGDFLRAAGILPEIVLTSPLVRAKQTAEHFGLSPNTLKTRIRREGWNR